MSPRLFLLPLLLCCAVPAHAADDPVDLPQDTPVLEEAHGPVMLDELAAWRSPVAGPLLTDGEYQVIRPTIRRRRALPGTHGEQLLVVPFETPSGDPALSIAVIARTAGGYRSRLLGNVLSNEIRSIRLVRLGHGGAPKVVVTERGGSGGFLTVRVFGTTRSGRWHSMWAVPGVYQGKYQLQPLMARVQRYIAGKVDAYPSGVWRETYVWRQDSFHLASRQRVRLKNPAGPGEAPRSLHAHAVD